MAEQEAIHQALEPLLDLEDGEILTGWIIVYEHARADGESCAGHFFGPSGMTSWRALGLLEWAKRFTIHSGSGGDEEED